ncbi:hypothetical protein BJF90_09985 [Pseudonocardia sp. CNS-004]|nr:hypothetical protein BJF90_09985 [Pseudonocardia sp. CNS-004]
MSRTARIVLAGALTLGALVAGGVALAANPAPSSSPSRTVSVEQGRPAELRPVQNTDDADCPARGAAATEL